MGDCGCEDQLENVFKSLKNQVNNKSCKCKEPANKCVCKGYKNETCVPCKHEDNCDCGPTLYSTALGPSIIESILATITAFLRFNTDRLSSESSIDISSNDENKTGKKTICNRKGSSSVSLSTSVACQTKTAFHSNKSTQINICPIIQCSNCPCQLNKCQSCNNYCQNISYCCINENVRYISDEKLEKELSSISSNSDTSITTFDTDIEIRKRNLEHLCSSKLHKIRYALTKITKLPDYTTFEILESKKKRPDDFPLLEGVFIFKNKN